MEVFCTTRFEGFHSWDDAPSEVAFLRDRHRHEFHVELAVEVDHDDRDIEFIMLKRALESYIEEVIQDRDWSCEQFAEAIADWAAEKYGQPARCEVSEDGENGARVSSEPKPETAPGALGWPRLF